MRMKGENYATFNPGYALGAAFGGIGEGIATAELERQKRAQDLSNKLLLMNNDLQNDLAKQHDQQSFQATQSANLFKQQSAEKALTAEQTAQKERFAEAAAFAKNGGENYANHPLTQQAKAIEEAATQRSINAHNDYDSPESHLTKAMIDKVDQQSAADMKRAHEIRRTAYDQVAGMPQPLTEVEKVAAQQMQVSDGNGGWIKGDAADAVLPRGTVRTLDNKGNLKITMPPKAEAFDFNKQYLAALNLVDKDSGQPIYTTQEAAQQALFAGQTHAIWQDVQSGKITFDEAQLKLAALTSPDASQHTFKSKIEARAKLEAQKAMDKANLDQQRAEEAQKKQDTINARIENEHNRHANEMMTQNYEHAVQMAELRAEPQIRKDMTEWETENQKGTGKYDSAMFAETRGYPTQAALDAQYERDKLNAEHAAWKKHLDNTLPPKPVLRPVMSDAPAPVKKTLTRAEAKTQMHAARPDVGDADLEAALNKAGY